MISFNDQSNKDFSFDAENLRKLVVNTIRLEGKVTGAVNYIFCSDTDLHQMNIQYLKHDTFTDIITFPMSESDKVISGDIYISPERVAENARKLQLKFPDELRRVVVHGILHLLGYDDRKPEEKALMRAKEDYYINLPPQQTS